MLFRFGMSGLTYSRGQGSFLKQPLPVLAHGLPRHVVQSGIAVDMGAVSTMREAFPRFFRQAGRKRGER